MAGHRSPVPHLDASSVEPHLTWSGVMQSIVDGHETGAAQVDDTLLRRGSDSLLSRAAWIDGLGAAVKTATVFPNNTGEVSAINGSVALFSDRTGELDCTLDFHLVTKWKTAADSALAASRLARADTEQILIVGSGTVAQSMIEAYRAVFPAARFTIWSRTPRNAALVANAPRYAEVVVETTDDLEAGVQSADVICTATMATKPLIRGDWLRRGQHLDLIGGYRTDMREADDDCVRRSSVFVDTLATARDVGDIGRPLEDGTLVDDDIVDFAGLASDSFTRSSDDQVTLFKNAGGAHLDLMVARHMFDRHLAVS